MSNESKNPENADPVLSKERSIEAPMSDERREALRKVLLSATCSVPVVTSLLAPRKAQAQIVIPSDPPPDP